VILLRPKEAEIFPFHQSVEFLIFSSRHRVDCLGNLREELLSQNIDFAFSDESLRFLVTPTWIPRIYEAAICLNELKQIGLRTRELLSEVLW
jgi:hypothetical protein